MKKHKARIAVIMIMLLLVCAGTCSIFADGDGLAAAPAAQHTHEGWTPWGDAESEKTALPSESGSYYLTSDIVLSSTHTWSQKEIKLCLNGHRISLAAAEGPVINLEFNTNFSLYDCSETERYFKTVSGGVWEDAGTQAPAGTVIALEDYNYNTANGTYVKTTGGCITGGKAAGIRMHDSKTCWVYIYGGNIVGNTNTNRGGGIDCNCGKIEICGGSISGNYTESWGGAIGYGEGDMDYLLGRYHELNVLGGSLTGNSSKSYGGAVSVLSGGRTTISGDALINGNRSGNYGGGIYADGKLIVEGGTIKGNKANTWGGGLYAASHGTIEMFDGLLSANTASKGGGIYDNKKTTITGGTISNNSATYGGGIYVGVNADFAIKNAKVVGNRAGKYGGGIDIDTDGKTSVISTEITGNSAGVSGGGIGWASENTVFGGNTKVVDNISVGSANNVLISTDHYITLAEGGDALADDAKIGISVQDLASNQLRRFTVSGTDSDRKFFVSDDTSANYGPWYDENGYLNIELLHVHKDANGKEYNFYPWNDGEKLPDGGKWFLTSDVTLTRDWQPKNDTMLCLNGHVISSERENCFWLEEVNLSIFDDEDSAVQYFKYSKSDAWTYLGTAAQKNAIDIKDFSLEKTPEGSIIAMHGGLITGYNMFIHDYSDYADPNKVTVDIYGGNIAGIGSDYSEPVNMQGDVCFNMYGGNIAGNFFPYGDIVCSHLGELHIFGGNITGNIASGAAVYSGSGNACSLEGSAFVHDNVTEKGGVFAEGCDLTLGGNAKVTGNATSKGTAKNIYLPKGKKIVLSSVESGMSAGVTTEVLPASDQAVLISGKAAASDAEHFFADADYKVKFKPSESSDDALYLIVNSGSASIFGGANVWMIAGLAAVVIAAIAAAVAASKKKKAKEQNS